MQKQKTQIQVQFKSKLNFRKMSDKTSLNSRGSNINRTNKELSLSLRQKRKFKQGIRRQQKCME